MDADDAKRALRALMRARRDEAGQDPGHDPGRLAAALSALAFPRDLILAGIHPLAGEPDLMPAWGALHAACHVVLMPETTPKGDPLRFRHWTPGVRMLAGRYGTRHPDGPEGRPDIVFVPLLAWDRRLARLGYGGGYYDRTLAGLPGALAIGIGYGFQEVARVPTGPHDVALSAVLTEDGPVTAEGIDFADLVSGRHRRSQRP